MKPEEQRIAIAEACGWKNADHPDVMARKEGWVMPEKWCMDPLGNLRFNHDRPDYLNDLNAMHEAEKVLNTAELWATYKNWLHRWMTEPVCATAAQRAEAFLRTLNLWVD